MRVRQGRWSARIFVVAAALLVAAAPAAGQGWTGNAITVSTPSIDARRPEPRLTVTPDGTAYAVWARYTQTGPLLQTAAYDPSSGVWSAPMTLAAVPEPEGFAFNVAVDDEGNIFVIASSFVGGRYHVRVLRYRRADGRMTVTTLSSTSTEPVSAVIGVDADGNATAVWTENGYVNAARYATAADSWSSAVELSGPNASWPGLVTDSQRNVTAIWLRRWPVVSPHTPPASIVQSARYLNAEGKWGPTTDLSGIGVPFGQPREADTPGTAVDGDGNVTAVWTRGAGPDQVVQVSRLPAGMSAWTLPKDISLLGGRDALPRIAAGPNGHVVVVWKRSVSGFGVILTSRFDPTTDTWSAPANLAAAGWPQLAVDAAGNAIAIWMRDLSLSYAPIETSRSTVIDPSWTAASRLSAPDGASSSPEIEFDAAGNATAVWAESRSGLSAVQSTQWIADDPQAPSNLVVTSVVGQSVTLGWDMPIGGGTPTGFAVEGGTAPGQTEATILTGGGAPYFTFAAPSGVFYVRMRTLLGTARSAPSNEVRLVVGAQLPPSPPAALLGITDGADLTLSWTNSFDGGTPTSLQLQVSGSLTETLTLPISERFNVSGVPAGTYTLRLSAINAAGASAPSNAVTLTVPGLCSAPPAMPTHVSLSAVGRTVSILWRAPTSGAAVTGYTVLVSGAFSADLSTIDRALSGTVVPGVYTVRVAAVNACGTGPATAAQSVNVR